MTLQFSSFSIPEGPKTKKRDSTHFVDVCKLQIEPKDRASFVFIFVATYCTLISPPANKVQGNSSDFKGKYTHVSPVTISLD